MSEFDFKADDFVVYPTHGVGKVLGIETETIGGDEVELIVVRFDSERMTLRVPTFKVPTSGLRKLSGWTNQSFRASDCDDVKIAS